jgi:hypothetical protein
MLGAGTGDRLLVGPKDEEKSLMIYKNNNSKSKFFPKGGLKASRNEDLSY